MSLEITQMNSLLSSQGTMKQMQTMDNVRTAVKGLLRTEKDEEVIAKLEERLQSIEHNMSDGMKELNERIAADREKIREEERAARKAKEKEDAAKTEQTGGPAAGVTAAVTETGTADTGDVAEFSPEGKEAAPNNGQAAPDTASGSGVYTPTTGMVIDKKV